MENECKYCQRKFINEKFLNRHQKTFKFCVDYQNKIIKEDLDNLEKQKTLIKNKIDTLNKSYDNLKKQDNYLTSKDIENEKTNEIEKLFLEFEKVGSIGLATNRDRWHTIKRQVSETKYIYFVYGCSLGHGRDGNNFRSLWLLRVPVTRLRRRRVEDDV
jgi:hypothetical protein